MFFKGLRYHGQNESVLLNDGYITWRYWLRRVKESEHARSGRPREVPKLGKGYGPKGTTGEGHRGGTKALDDLPCRVVLESRGLQWFIYNRSPAYDAILKSMLGGAGDVQTSDGAHSKQSSSLNKEFSAQRGPHRPPSSSAKSKAEMDEKLGVDTDYKISGSISTERTGDVPAYNSNDSANTLPSILNILPIKVECSKGAIVMGNQNTRSVLTIQFEAVVGYIDARSSRTLDQYKQCIDLDFVHPVVQLKPNRDFRETQLAAGARIKSDEAQGPTLRKPWHILFMCRQRLHRALTSFRDLNPYGKSSVESFPHDRSRRNPGSPVDDTGVPGQHRWLGLTRYLDDDDELVEQERWKAIEYGRVSTVVDSPKIAVSIYWDVPGLIPSPTDSNSGKISVFASDINGNVPPDWGVELRIGGGTISYGPWTDKQRSDLQNVFFPTLHRDATPAVMLKPGQRRVSTVFKCVIEIEKETSLQIPTREESKDWKWKDRANNGNGPEAKKKGKMGHVRKKRGQKAVPTPDIRPFGWLDVKVLPNSTISFTMDLVASSNGYKSRVDIDLKEPEMSSSVNHGLLWRSKTQAISCDLSYPLRWNTPRQWHVDVRCDGLQMFLLRDHVYLLTDLINDWASGPPGDFHLFVPFEYAISLHFTDFKLYINANDSNIIDNPSDTDDNTFVVIWGERLNAQLNIPMKKFRPTQNKITFDISASNGGFELRMPPWNTQHVFLDNANVATLKALRIDASYNYFTSTSPTLTDILLLDVHGSSLELHLYGFLIRYLMKIKDNYFGEDLHFRTLEEYQDQIVRKELSPETSLSSSPSKLGNDLDVILNINADNAGVLLPAHLYSATENLRLDISSIIGDFRFTNYYMDLAVSFSPIAMSRTVTMECSSSGSVADSSTQIFIDGLDTFGHRLFGLPPTEPTYVCNWDFVVGAITGECSTDFLRSLMLALRCFALSFGDGENALPPLHPPVIHDVTFLRARVHPISVWVRMQEKALLFSTARIKFNYNDWAGPLFSERFTVFIPDLSLAMIDISTLSKDRRNMHSLSITHAFFETTIMLRMVKQKSESKKDRALQQNHINIHDARTQRTPWLLQHLDQVQTIGIPSRQTRIRPPAMPYPQMPEPISDGNRSMIDRASFSSASIQTSSSRRSSFLTKVSQRQVSARRRAGKAAAGSLDAESRSSDKRLQPAISDSRVMPSNPSQAHSPNGRAHRIYNGSNIGGVCITEKSPVTSGFTFSSPYKRPYFLLHAVNLDTSGVPFLPEKLPSEHVMKGASAFERLEAPLSTQDIEQSSLFIHFSRGLRTFCTPEALGQVSVALDQLKPQNTLDLLDTLQIDAMTDLSKPDKKRSNQRKVIEFKVFMPWLHTRFLNSIRSEPKALVCCEELDVVIANLTATARSTEEFLGQEENNGDQRVLHLILDRVSCSARTKSARDPLEDQALMQLTVTDPVLWISSGRRVSADLQFRDLGITSTGRTVDHISSLIEQAATLTKGPLTRLSETTKKHAIRLRMLVLALTKNWDSIPDPPFLTRASYVLRSATSHLRTSDSWKMLSRLRYVHQSLPSHLHAQIFRECKQIPVFSQEEARSRVLDRLEQWRAWDVAHVRESPFIRIVFGQLNDPAREHTLRRAPVGMAIRAGRIQILLEPGPNENQISINRLVVSTTMYEPGKPVIDGSGQRVSTTVCSTIDAYSETSTISLNWDLCKLLEDLIRLFQASKNPTQAQLSRDLPTKTAHAVHTVHMTTYSKTAIVNLNSINLEATTICEGLKASVLVLNMPGGCQGSTTSVLVNANNTSSQVWSHSRSLTLFELHRPSMFYSGSNRPEDRSGSRRLATSCNKLSFMVLEHPLGLLEVADLLLKDELVFIKEVIQPLQRAGDSKHSTTLSSGPIGQERFHVALFLNSYEISFTILPSMTYNVSGQVARTSIQSGTHHESKILVDFDVKDHKHIVTSEDDHASDEISTMHMPPTNGRIILDLYSSQKSVVFHGMIESIVLDASAVHALLVTANRPEVSSLASSIHREFDLVQENYAKIIPSKPQKVSDHQEPILYSAYVTWAGLTVNANTVTSTSGSEGAQLRFDLGCLQLKATNRDHEHKRALMFPELALIVRGMEMNLTRPDSSGLRPCGNFGIGATFRSTSEVNESEKLIRSYRIQSTNLELNLYAETASATIEILTHLQDRLRSIDLSNEVKALRKHRRATLQGDGFSSNLADTEDPVSNFLSSAMYSLEMAAVRVCWKMGSLTPISPSREVEDLVLSFTRIDLSTRRDNAARLLVQDLQLQMSPVSGKKNSRSLNSALLPEVVFKVAYLSTTRDRRLAFQAAGKSLDIRLTPQFILPATALRRSIAIGVGDLRAARNASKKSPPVQTGSQMQSLFSHKKLASLLIDADFAGAVVYIQGQRSTDPISPVVDAHRSSRPTQHGRYGQFTHKDESSSTTLRAPGIALKVEYKDAGVNKQSLNAEFKVDASSNILYPTVVPLIMEITSSVKEIVEDSDTLEQPVDSKPSPPKFLGEESLSAADPSAILGNCRLDLGLRIRRQEFSLSCQPIARVAATAHFDEIYITVNTVQSSDYGQFFTLSAAFTRLQAAVQHAYSRDSTASFDVDSVVLSLMNSKHVSAANGVSAILKISPIKALVNAKQMQDFLLFREIWIPPEIRDSSDPPMLTSAAEPQAFIVERYQQVAAAGAFPWNATVSIAELDVQLDLGQSLGKSTFVVSNFWVSSKKTSDWEQNLCLGFEKVGMNSKGRMSGFIALQNFRVRTSIQWPLTQQTQKRTPLIQASLGFGQLRMKAAFDFQAFLVADITSFNFLMYNVQDTQQAHGDRLVGMVDGDKVQVFCITTSASQGLALYQAIQRLIQEKRAAYETSLRDIEKYLRRKSSIRPFSPQAAANRGRAESREVTQAPLQLQTDVVVALKAINVGAFPGTFFDNQIFKLEALDATARFAVKLDGGRVHSNLGMTLGQLRIALSGITRPTAPKTLGEVSVDDVITSATGSRGGTILKVPRLVATMQTWQTPASTHIDYMFKSLFQGKVDVGWNYSRIGFLRGMWASHNRALAQRLGKPLPQSALQITGGPQPEGEGGGDSKQTGEARQEKITAVVNVPQSKYQYTALQPAIIETPQLRDMGEATPPLEWIGLHRDRLPNLTHQIVIVTLLEVAREVEDAYSKILGSA